MQQHYGDPKSETRAGRAASGEVDMGGADTEGAHPFGGCVQRHPGLDLAFMCFRGN